MKRVKIKITEIHNLHNLFKSRANEKIVNDYFLKNTNKYTKNKFKPGSEKYIKEEERLQSIKNLPDYDIKEVGVLEIKSDSLDKIEYTILEYDTQDYDWEGVPYIRTCTFLTDNSYRGHNKMYSSDDILEQRKVREMLFKQLERNQYDKLHKSLLNVGEKFIILIDKVVKARSEFIEVKYYKRYQKYGRAVVIGEEVFGEEEIERIYDSWKNNERFYNSDDELESYYSCDCYVDYYRKYNNGEDLDEADQHGSSYYGDKH